ncbi:MAG: SMC-Scp complex subunit ScpB, partial [Thermoleophilia bacterium]
LRGVAVDSTVASLLERGLLEEAGRPPDGGAMRYRTTRLFQERFGLRRAGDLPPLEGFELSGPEAERVRAQLVNAGHLPAEDAVPDTEPAEPDDG